MTFEGGTSSIVSRLRSALFTPKGLLVLFGLILVIIAIYYAYYYIVYPKLKPSYVANNELKPASSQGGKEAEIMLFYADWCPHCKTAKPEWNQVKEKYNGKTINGYTIIFTEYNCTEENPQIEQKMTQYKIEGFPTIKMLKDGKVIEFDAKPNQQNLEKFLNTV